MELSYSEKREEKLSVSCDGGNVVNFDARGRISNTCFNNYLIDRRNPTLLTPKLYIYFNSHLSVNTERKFFCSHFFFASKCSLLTLRAPDC